MSVKSATSGAGKTSRKSATGSKATTAKSKTGSKTGKLPEWNLADLYSGIDAPEIARDLQKMDADCTAFEADYKAKLAEGVARDDGGLWLADAVRRYDAIDDLAGRLGSYAGLVHAGDSVDPLISIFYGDVSERLTAASLHLMFFALIIGVAITLLPGTVSAPFVRGMGALFEITSKIIDIIMKFAPYAVACLIFTNMARFGIDLLGALGWFVATVLLGLGLQMFGVYSLSIYFLSKMNPLEFFKRVRTVIVTAFSTSSSNATLPTALRISEENLGVPKHINSFVLTVGATANQNGTALYEGITVLFLAQLAGVDLTLGLQLMVVYLAILGGIGTAGVPSGSIPFIIGILAMIGIDPALIAIILGVDRILDMCRTTLNVVGDITEATFVARSEGFELLQTRENVEIS